MNDDKKKSPVQQGIDWSILKLTILNLAPQETAVFFCCLAI